MVIVVRPSASVVEGLLHGALGLGVEGAGRLVEHQHPRVAQQGAGDREALLLPAGEAVAARADHGVVARRAATAIRSWICAARAASSISASVASGRA